MAKDEQNELLPGLVEMGANAEFIKDIERFKQPCYFKTDPDSKYPETAFVYPKEPYPPGLYTQKVSMNKTTPTKTLGYLVEFIPATSF